MTSLTGLYTGPWTFSGTDHRSTIFGSTAEIQNEIITRGPGLQA
jgi:hypothetical protein